MRGVFSGPEAFTNKHMTLTQVRPSAMPANLDASRQRPAAEAWRLGLAALQAVVRRAEEAGATLVPIGSTWSLSDAIHAREDGRLVRTSLLNEIPVVGMDAAHVCPGVERDLLVFAQSGCTLASMHTRLAPHGLALPTSSASCGQTLGGAFSTGTHGAALEFGACHDMVRGVHLVITGGESVWVEPASEHVVTDAWCEAIGARLVRDDDVFAAALVSFGTMGLVHGYLIQTRPMYKLRSLCVATKLSKLYAGVRRSGNAAVIQLPTSILPEGTSDIVHLGVSIDANTTRDACRLRVLYAAGDAPGYLPDFSPAAHPGAGDDALLDISTLMNGIGHVLRGATDPLVKRQAAALLAKQAPLSGPSAPKALGEFFPRIDFQPGGMSTEIGVDVNDWRRAVRVVLATIRARTHAYPGIVSLRFVRGSSQFLALTRFPVTCTIELPIANTNETQALFQSVWDALDAEGITHTLHWGQANGLAPGEANRAKNAERVDKMYGADAVARWKKARRTLLGATGAKTFRNVLSDACGLTSP